MPVTCPASKDLPAREMVARLPILFSENRVISMKSFTEYSEAGGMMPATEYCLAFAVDSSRGSASSSSIRLLPWVTAGEEGSVMSAVRMPATGFGMLKRIFFTGSPSRLAPLGR